MGQWRVRSPFPRPVFVPNVYRYGRLGHGDENRQNAPKVVEGALIYQRYTFASCDTVEGLSGKSISFIACGGFHTAAITDRGALYTWGGGYFGQLGQGDEADKKMPRRCLPAPLRAKP